MNVKKTLIVEFKEYAENTNAERFPLKILLKSVIHVDWILTASIENTQLNAFAMMAFLEIQF